MAQVWMQTETGQIGVAKTYSNAKKLFQIGNLPIGVMSYGAANIGDRSIEGLVREFRTPRAKVQTIAESFFEFVQDAYMQAYGGRPPEQQPPAGFFIAGYSAKSPFAEEWEFVLPRDTQVGEVRPKTEFGASWRGFVIPFTRLYYGFDPQMMQWFEDVGVLEEVRRGLFDEKRYRTHVPYHAMPVQDAINFAEFVLQTTIGYSSIQVGPPTCGGPLQVSVILPESGFEWVSRPKFGIGGQRYV
jgi:hypothetical protein